MTLSIDAIQDTLEKQGWDCVRFEETGPGLVALAAQSVFRADKVEDEIVIDILENGTSFVHTNMLCVKLHPELARAIASIMLWRGW